MKRSSTGTTLYPCEPVYWKSVPKPVRYVLGWVTIIGFALSFTLPLFLGLLILPPLWRLAPYLCGGFVAVVIISMLVPMKEWLFARKVGQLWYEIFRFSCNLSPEDLSKVIKHGDDHKLIIAMHPHGIVPFQAVLWTSYCDQYMTDPKTGKALYGFGAAADVVMFMPVLRNIMGWLTAGSATYKSLKDGLMKGISPPANAAGRTPKNLYILPGGVAEVFTSTPGKNIIVFKKRRGLIKLAIETGAELVPCYVFGGTDFYNNLATDGGFFASISRWLRAGITIFWGPVPFIPVIPYTPRVTMVIGDPLPVPKVWDAEVKGEPVPRELIDELHARFLKATTELFDQYKAAAGYPDAVLEVE